MTKFAPFLRNIPNNHSTNQIYDYTMTKSALQIARAAYQPKMPQALTGYVKMKEGAVNESVADQAAIKGLFPNTYGMPLVSFEPSEVATKFDPINVGVILGPGGLVDHNYMELTAEIIDEYRNTGGFDIIGSGRTKLETHEQFDKGLVVLKALYLTDLVIIG